MIPEYSENPLYFGWPFWVLDLTPSANTSDVEKAAHDLTAKLQLKVPDAETYLTPVGMQTRDAFLIREAKSTLQDPNSRLLAEFWYYPPNKGNGSQVSTEDYSIAFWYDALGLSL
jgi:hypothetical protein